MKHVTEQGQASIEYALLLAIVCVGICIAVMTYANGIMDAVNEALPELWNL
ncbi:MAG: hypothetical protein WD557_04405 [Dehalococcoidia bacterium]